MPLDFLLVILRPIALPSVVLRPIALLSVILRPIALLSVILRPIAPLSVPQSWSVPGRRLLPLVQPSPLRELPAVPDARDPAPPAARALSTDQAARAAQHRHCGLPGQSPRAPRLPHSQERCSSAQGRSF